MDGTREAFELVEQLGNACSHGLHTSILSPVTYDTAWVSMVSKVKDDGVRYWLFPECFQTVLNHQLPTGAWGDNASEVDGILNTMTALLAVLKHRDELHVRGCSDLPLDTSLRISKSVDWLRKALRDWDVEASEHVGFELLVPSLLELLHQKDLNFEFPGTEALATLNQRKLAKFDVKALYGPGRTTLVHSLEAFVGTLDFDMVAHHKMNGSMMASPASTAAYLMQISSWDDEAEDYLEEVFYKGPGQGSGWFPSAFPTTVFESSWIMSTLLSSGFTTDELGSANVTEVANFLENALSPEDGIVGFAPGIMADADDTAKAILALTLCGRNSVCPDKLISSFESKDYFRTFESERNPSFSANCNILMALLHTCSPQKYSVQVYKAVSFLCEIWWYGQLRDKWNNSIEYPVMLLAQALVQFLQKFKKTESTSAPERTSCDDVSIIVAQILTRTLQNQGVDGSWGQGSFEITAYSILTLLSITKVPWIGSFCLEASQAAEKGKHFLRQERGWLMPAQYIWVEKVSYSSEILSQAYCLAALKASSHATLQTNDTQCPENLVKTAVTQGLKLFSRIQLFSSMPEWKLKCSLLEGSLFFPRLKEKGQEIFQKRRHSKDDYLKYIPFSWIGCKNLNNSSQNNTVLWEMMIISMLNYQADEYMEAIVGTIHQENLELVKKMIMRLCQNTSIKETDLSDICCDSGQSLGTSCDPVLTQIAKTLFRFTKYVFSHPDVLSSPASTRIRLHHEVATFLLAHITQIEDNSSFITQTHTQDTPTTFATPRDTYYKWVRTTSADHTSCPYSFVFFTCLIGKPGAEVFRTAKQRYLAEDLTRHLATLCRMYNDYGSVVRDREEINLNSVNFPDFDDWSIEHENQGANRSNGSSDSGSNAEYTVQVTSNGDSKKKADLMWLAEYERECLNMCLDRLEKEIPVDLMENLKLFVNVTDLYGQIYVSRDIGIRTKQRGVDGQTNAIAT